MLKHNQCPARLTQLLRINIIRCPLQAFHVKIAIHRLLLTLKNTDVKGVRPSNPVALAVDNLNREIDFIINITAAFSVNQKFLLDTPLRFLDCHVNPIKT